MNDTLWPFLQTKTEDHLQSFFLKKKKNPTNSSLSGSGTAGLPDPWVILPPWGSLLHLCIGEAN